LPFRKGVSGRKNDTLTGRFPFNQRRRAYFEGAPLEGLFSGSILMNYETIRYDLSEGIAVILLNREEKMNALNAQMRAEITDAVKTASAEARVIVLTGAGRAFCSGQDLGDSASVAAIDLEGTLRDEYEPMLRAIAESPVPTIAAVNGAAAGAGANLALACDVVIASEAAVFVQAFTRIGLMPDAGGSYWLPRQMGAAKAMGAALFAEAISARQASDWGMIWEAVPEAEFEAHWLARATTLATGPTLAYAAVKTALRAAWQNSEEEQLALEAHQQGQLGQTRDFQEGVMAFLEKRKAGFEGR
jgi:2-(1,2-epoxy-1,2-dihydrophenyl)acetyl-CoA isomerase